MPNQHPIQGECDPCFSRVRETFTENFASRGDHGAAVSVIVDGRKVVDLWGGFASQDQSRLWERDTMVNTHSVSKAVTATCAHLLVDRGLLDIDSPVADYWPEFAEEGKEGVLVRHLLNHQAGLPAIGKSLPMGSLLKWDVMTKALAHQRPWWAPGSKHGYHLLTFGFLVGEVVRRICGKSLGTFLREEISEPYEIDFHIGLQDKDLARSADTLSPLDPAPGEANWLAQLMADPGSLSARGLLNPPDFGEPDAVNQTAWRKAEIPASNGQGSARGVARLFGALAMRGNLEGKQLLSPEIVQRAIREESNGSDAVMSMFPSRVGLGYWLSNESCPFGPNRSSFGHPGAGGTFGFGDPDAQVGFAYVTNRMLIEEKLIDRRGLSLIDAVYASLGV